ncbi:MAG: hypothetical protein ACREX9_03180 [Gammaproteobacteria bacterium]
MLALTVRERLQAIEDLAELGARIAGSLRPTERNAAADIPTSVPGAGKGVPGEKGGSFLGLIGFARRKLGVRSRSVM